MKNDIILYDGNCRFCLNCISFVKKNIQNNKILFYPQKSKEANDIMTILSIKNIDSVIYISDKEIFLKSEALLKISKKLKFPYYLLNIFNFFPQILLDNFYNFIAKRRYYFYKKENCCNGN